jgi:hypothetical protein
VLDRRQIFEQPAEYILQLTGVRLVLSFESDTLMFKKGNQTESNLKEVERRCAFTAWDEFPSRLCQVRLPFVEFGLRSMIKM